MLDLFGVVIERLRPGVIVDSLGVVGRRLGSLRSWDWSVIGEQLATRDPRLVVLQYGTNEADDPDLVLEDMAKYYDETILRIRAAAPTASILILGPPDMGVREAGKSCDRMKPKPRRGRDARVRVANAGASCARSSPSSTRPRCATTSRSSTRSRRWAAPISMHGWVIARAQGRVQRSRPLHDVGYQRWADALSGALLARVRALAAGEGLAAERSRDSLLRRRSAADTPLPGPGRSLMLFSNPDYPIFLIAVFFLYALSRVGGRARMSGRAPR